MSEGEFDKGTREALDALQQEADGIANKLAQATIEKHNATKTLARYTEIEATLGSKLKAYKRAIEAVQQLALIDKLREEGPDAK